MRNGRIKDICSLKDHPVPAQALEAGRMRLQAYMAARPMIRPVQQPSWSGRAFMWKPMMAVAIGLVTLSSAGGAVFASEASLPGDRLYRVKRWSEEVRAKLAFSADSRFWVRAEQAERRLTEAEAVMNGLMMEDEDAAGFDGRREAKLKLAMDAYAAHVVAMNANAPENFEAMFAVDRVVERHESLVGTATGTETRAMVVGPIEIVIELEGKLHDALTSAREDIDTRSRARIERLRRLQADLPPAHVEHEEHDHVDVDEMKEPVPPVSIEAASGIEVKTKINTNLNLKVEAAPANRIGL